MLAATYRIQLGMMIHDIAQAMGVVPDDERGAADRRRAFPQRQATSCVRVTRHRSRSGRWSPLLGLPVVCCVGHVLLIIKGVGSLTAVTGAVTASVAVTSAGLLLPGGVVVLVLLRRPGQPAAPADRPDSATRTPLVNPDDPGSTDRSRARTGRRILATKAMKQPGGNRRPGRLTTWWRRRPPPWSGWS